MAMIDLYDSIANDLSRLSRLIRRTDHMPQEADRKAYYIDRAIDKHVLPAEGAVDPRVVLSVLMTLFRYYDEVRVLFSGNKSAYRGFEEVMASLQQHKIDLCQQVENEKA